jgi:hypothetical protein
MPTLSIPPGSSIQFKGRLLDHERITWVGQPAQGFVLTARDGLLIPFSLMWCGFTIFWTYQVATTSAPWFFLLSGAMFVCVGLYLVFGRFIVDAWIRRCTYYAVTDSRILIARSGFSNKFSALRFQQLPEMALSERNDGRGTIRFGPQGSMWSGRRMGWSVWTPSLDEVPQFLLIEKAREVFDLIQRSSKA